MKTVSIDISVDSGSAELFRWIKGKDLYYEVWDNIEKYVKAQYSPELVRVKYIIIPEINDDKEEIIKFLDEAVFRKVKNVAFDIEMNWFDENKDCIPESIKDLVKFTKEEAERRSLNYSAINRAAGLV